MTARSVHAKTANGGDASWSYIVDPIMVSNSMSHPGHVAWEAWCLSSACL